MGRPCFAVLLIEGRKTETDLQSTKKDHENKLSKKQPKEGLLSRPEQLSTGQAATATRPKIHFKRRKANRSLATETLLNLLRDEAPSFFAVAEAVGEVGLDSVYREACSTPGER